MTKLDIVLQHIVDSASVAVMDAFQEKYKAYQTMDRDELTNVLNLIEDAAQSAITKYGCTSAAIAVIGLTIIQTGLMLGAAMALDEAPVGGAETDWLKAMGIDLGAPGAEGVGQ